MVPKSQKQQQQITISYPHTTHTLHGGTTAITKSRQELAAAIIAGGV
jgi:hypothetical protein